MSDYPRHLILGTLEHEQFISDAYRYGWISRPTLLESFKQKICRHDFSLWCINKGVQDVRILKCRHCNKCGYDEVSE